MKWRGCQLSCQISSFDLLGIVVSFTEMTSAFKNFLMETLGCSERTLLRRMKAGMICVVEENRPQSLALVLEGFRRLYMPELTLLNLGRLPNVSFVTHLITS